jgi:sigma-B regulation protein RsbU (phosphoserine phosphatase)
MVANIKDVDFRTLLLDRRERLVAGINVAGEAEGLVHLLHQVDSALEELDKGTYGLCEVCHDPVEKERLLADPLMRFCLDHLTAPQRRALEQDLELASQIQNQLLPDKNLRSQGWEICSYYLPRGPVSGDYCDVLGAPVENGELFLLLGDISGKGVAASLLMTHLHAIFRSLIPLGLSVGQLVERANRIFCDSTMSDHFATLVCARARPAGELEICNAGHCPPVLLRGSDVLSITATELPLGLFGTQQYSSQSFDLRPGDRVFLYTDGLSETMNPSKAQYGVGRLSKFVSEHRQLPPRELVEACVNDLNAFRAGVPLRDDLSIMVAERLGDSRV